MVNSVAKVAAPAQQAVPAKTSTTAQPAAASQTQASTARDGFSSSGPVTATLSLPGVSQSMMNQLATLSRDVIQALSGNSLSVSSASLGVMSPEDLAKCLAVNGSTASTATPFSLTTATSTAAPITTSQTTATTTTPAAAVPTGITGNGAALTRDVVVAQIDLFKPDSTGFNHGAYIANRMNNGGGDPSLAGKVDLMQFPLSGTGDIGEIADKLDAVANLVRSGKTIDAVELPQQAFQTDADTVRVQNSIKQLQALGVPVVAAAGNGTKSQRNALSQTAAFSVQNIENGRLDFQSSPGNVNFAGTTTSFASGDLAPIVAAKRAMGLSIAQIFQQVSAATK